jgi:hypothetical protein
MILAMSIFHNYAIQRMYVIQNLVQVSAHHQVLSLVPKEIHEFLLRGLRLSNVFWSRSLGFFTKKSFAACNIRSVFTSNPDSINKKNSYS